MSTQPGRASAHHLGDVAICVVMLVALALAVVAITDVAGAAEEDTDSAAVADLVFGAPATAGDVETTRRILTEAGVETDPAQPGLGTYLQDVGAAFGRLLARLADRLAPRLSGLIKLFGRIDPRWLWAAFFALGIWIAWRLLSRRRPPEIRTRVRVEPLSPDSAEHPSQRDWEAILSARLAAGDALGALEALWWWLAKRLGATAAERSWTSRELVTRAQRADLLPAVRTFDRLAYGGDVPAGDDVRRYRDRLAELVG